MISKEDLKKIYRAAIDAANPEKAIHDCLRLKKNILELYADAKIFFEALGDLIVTGPTHTNVMDIRIILVSNDK